MLITYIKGGTPAQIVLEKGSAMTRATFGIFLPKLSRFIDRCCYTQVRYTGSWGASSYCFMFKSKWAQIETSCMTMNSSKFLIVISVNSFCDPIYTNKKEITLRSSTQKLKLNIHLWLTRFLKYILQFSDFTRCPDNAAAHGAQRSMWMWQWHWRWSRSYHSNTSSTVF